MGRGRYEEEEEEICNQEIESPIPIPICNLGGVIVFASSDLLIWVTARSLKRVGGPDALADRRNTRSRTWSGAAQLGPLPFGNKNKRPFRDYHYCYAAAAAGRDRDRQWPLNRSRL